jgi:tetratricopeptide (TPR) repeat protein
VAIIAECEGVPLHLEQALYAMREGAVVEGRGGLSDLISSRVQALTPGARHTVQALSVVGQEARHELLSLMVPPEEDIQAACALLTAHGILRESTVGTVAFAHPFFCDVTYAGLPNDVRRELHARTFKLLENMQVSPAITAHHADGGELKKQALPLLEEAGRECEAALDSHGATANYSRAWEYERWNYLQGEEARPTRLLRIGLRFGEALFGTGDFALAQGVLVEVLEYAAGFLATQARVKLVLARIAKEQGNPAKAVELLRDSLQQAHKAGDAALLVSIYLELSEILMQQGQAAVAMRDLETGVLQCQGKGGVDSQPANLWQLLIRMVELYGRQGQFDAALRIAHDALKSAERVSAKVGEARAYELLGEMVSSAGAAHRTKAVQALRQVGDRQGQARLLLILGAEALGEGNMALARDRLHAARDLARAVDWAEGADRAAKLATALDSL